MKNNQQSGAPRLEEPNHHEIQNGPHDESQNLIALFSQKSPKEAKNLVNRDDKMINRSCSAATRSSVS